VQLATARDADRREMPIERGQIEALERSHPACLPQR
jgi:hypothetical protein